MPPAYRKKPRPLGPNDHWGRKRKIVWRISYLDWDFGQCFTWAPDYATALRVRDQLIEHYRHDTPHTGPPEVFIGRVDVPTNTRHELAAWLSLHLTCGPRLPRPASNPQTPYHPPQPELPDHVKPF